MGSCHSLPKDSITAKSSSPSRRKEALSQHREKTNDSSLNPSQENPRLPTERQVISATSEDRRDPVPDRSEIRITSAPILDVPPEPKNVGTATLTNDIQERSNSNSFPELKILEEEILQRLLKLQEAPLILPGTLNEHWGPHYTQFYRRQIWHEHEWSETDKIKREYIKIVSILILANFNKWPLFRKIFIDTPGRTDKNLPFNKDDLMRPDFLGTRVGHVFWDYQWPFCPFVIEQRRGPHKKDNPLQPFPFVHEDKIIGDGAAGTVFKRSIAAGHLKYKNGAVNEENKVVAVKEVDEREVEHVEFVTLKQLRDSLARHDRIMVNIATILADSPKGLKHMMFYDLADYNLHEFLTERHYSTPDRRPSDHLRDRARRLHCRGEFMRNGSHYHQAYDLIRESRNLADALDYLQNRLYFDGVLSLSHNDLRPQNILVFYPDNEEPCPVGQWKIADFGLAKIKAKGPRTSMTYLSSKFLQPQAAADKLETDFTHRRRLSQTSARSVSITTVKRHPGRHTAPEVQVPGAPQQDGRAGDIWSFGCILAEVLAYSVAFHLVEELQKVCLSGFDNDIFYDQNTLEVKDGVRQWLRELPDRCFAPPKWIEECVTLIEDILKKDPTNRPKAGSIRDRLRDITEGMDKKDNFRLVDGAVPPPITVITSNLPHDAGNTEPLSDRSEHVESPTDTGPRNSQLSAPGIEVTDYEDYSPRRTKSSQVRVRDHLDDLVL